MEKFIDTNLGYLSVTVKYKGENYELERLLIYHERSLDEKTEDIFEDYIYFTSPHRCNMYGSKMTRLEGYNTKMKKEDDCFILQRDNNLYYIHRRDYIKISGMIDFLIYHKFKTSEVDISKTLDDKKNFDVAVKEAKNIIQVVYSDMLNIKLEHCKLILKFEDWVEPERH